ncbi:HTH-type transcriptional regulator CdhR [BD1-7 clade bacterium]|uniref:HTH-type transcriptional regulator CdhR n=1 Tax=BD1-7 clade bacterium TaxID=2029982 RepID=A0A5S9N893_9GAMM|nr:HTH-type transcriptional regulator CdhR [BD1-7 clade bacterium]
MQSTPVSVLVIDYPGAMQSAIAGWKDLFALANRVTEEDAAEARFIVDCAHVDHLPANAAYTLVLLPPSVEGDYYCTPANALIDWLLQRHRQGSVLCSACAGSFILAATGLVDGRPVTTHWALANELADAYPQLRLDAQEILVNDGDIISAGGLMSWVDLGLEIVAQYAGAATMRKLGRYMIVDTAKRQQQYYSSFSPRFDHGDAAVVKAQHFLQQHYTKPLRIPDLAKHTHLSERTLLRRFTENTELSPLMYLQRVRVQKACDLLESSQQSIESITYQVGYNDVSAFRKIFKRTMGLSPAEFRLRFGGPR